MSRLRTWPAWRVSSVRRSNSVRVSATSRPSRVDRPSGEVDGDRPEMEPGGLVRAAAGSTKCRPDAGDQLRHFERLLDVVVGAGLETDDDVDACRRGRSASRPASVDERRIARHTSRPSSRGSMTSRRTRSNGSAVNRSRPSAAVGGGLDREAGIAQPDGRDLADRRVVFDEQDPGVQASSRRVRRQYASRGRRPERGRRPIPASPRTRRSRGRAARPGSARCPSAASTNVPAMSMNTTGTPCASPSCVDDEAVDDRPERPDPERHREVERVRGVARGGRRDVAEERLELRALGEGEQAHQDDADPQQQQIRRPAARKTTNPTHRRDRRR